MATWPNTIDDDGTGESGLSLDDAFFDQVKAYIDERTSAFLPWTFQRAVLSGALSNDFGANAGVPLAGHSIVELATNEAFTITGIKPAAAPFTGQTIVFANAAPQPLAFTHEDARSTAGFRLRCQATSVTANSFWGYAIFQYAMFSSGGFGLCIGRANGHGG